jgi:hypothetical protein
VVIYNGATLSLTGVYPLTTTDLFIVEFVNITGRCLFNVNKAIDGNSAKISFATGTWTQVIGGTTTSGAVSYDGQIYEVIIFNRALTGDERSSITNYLFKKWNIAPGALLTSVSQPYVSIPPFLRTPTPTDVAGCTLWLDAADATTVTLSGSSVTQWNDKSGLVNHASGGVSPTYDRTTNAVVFNGTTHYLTSPQSASLTTETLFMVGTLTGSTASGNYHTLVASSLNGGRHLFTNATGLNVNSQNVAPGPLGGTFSANQRTLFQYGRDLTNTVTLLLNGSSVATASLAAYTASLTTWIGRWPGTTTDNWQGSIHELIIYDKTLSKSERQFIEGYLAQKWGLKTGLPSTHSFRTELALTPRFDVRKFGPRLWLDAADLSTITDAGAYVSSWRDKSGNGIEYTTNVTGRNAGLVYDGIYPGIYFDGNQIRQFQGSSGYLPSTTWTMFIVCNITAGSGTIFMIYKSTTAGAVNYIRLRGDTGGVLIQYADTTPASLKSGGGGFVQGSRGMMAITDNSSRTTVAPDMTSTNGTLMNVNRSGGTTATVATWLGGVNFGMASTAGGTLSNPFTGYIHEFILYVRDLSYTERHQVEGYLAWKWGIQSKLPNTHPYSKYPPN